MANLAGTCGLGLPLAIFLGLFTSLGQYGVFYAKGADEITKFIFFFLRYQTPAWQGQIATGWHGRGYHEAVFCWRDWLETNRGVI